MPRVVVCAPDLMDQSKIRAAAASAAPNLEIDLVFVRSAALAVAAIGDPPADVVVLDLSRPGVLDAIDALATARRQRGHPLAMVGFGSHVDRELLDGAAAHGCDRVLPRSGFFAALPAVLAPGAADGR
jgi:CheY-like chemotaxis protein